MTHQQARAIAFAMIATLGFASHLQAAPPELPIIDMHVHAFPLSEFGPTPPVGCYMGEDSHWHGVDPSKPMFEQMFDPSVCRKPMPAPTSDALVRDGSLDRFKKYNMYAVTSGELDRVEDWRKAAPHRIIPSLNFFNGAGGVKPGYVDELRRLHAEKRVAVFGEVTAQYRGLSPADPSLEPFFALAEELDVPVGIHMGYGAPGGPYWAYPNYRASLGNPLLLEEVLVKHPKLRLYVMHAGFPMVDELIALLYSHPQVYVDVSSDNGGQRNAEFYHGLKRLMDAGYGKRIMFGSDQMVWPQIIDVAINGIKSAPFLSVEQKRDIFYNNAARFLRLDEAQIARHHAGE